MQAEREQIRTVRKSRLAPVLDIRDVAATFKHMIANTSLKDFRVAFAAAEVLDEGVILTPETARVLSVRKDGEVRLIEA